MQCQTFIFHLNKLVHPIIYSLNCYLNSSLTYSFYVFFILAFFIVTPKSMAQVVEVGAGSYTTTLPSGAVGPQNFTGQNISPKISEAFEGPVQTNDFWSSLLFPFFGNQHSGKLFAHPLAMQAKNNGLELGYTTNHIFAAADHLYPYAAQLTVGVAGLNASKTTTLRYDDWTVTAEWKDTDQSLHATLGHGLPFVYFKVVGGDATLNFSRTPTVWYNESGVLGLTVDGRHYGVFAPTGSSWETGSTYRSNLNGKDYLSVALLPDNTQATLQEFKSRAYAFVTNSVVEWDYDEATAKVQSTYRYETVLMDSAEGNRNETISALYRHQWLNVNEALTDYSYASPRGEMKVFAGNTFSTTLTFQGVLPTLPDQGDYNPDVLSELVAEVATENLGVGPTYENGKAMARFANLVHIADQQGMTDERDYFLAALKTRLEDWFTAGGSQQYMYNAQWDVLTGYPSGFGADNQINDHHFHTSYAIVSAATIAQYDSAWASQEQWGEMVNMLIRDANNWSRDDDMFPFLRSHDIYAGHSWAAGHGDFAEGNNQESSSESMNFSSAVILWGEVTGQTDIRDMGIFLYATETTAVEQYWFDVDNEVFPDEYPYVSIAMVWGAKGVHSTWFGGEPEFIHGINLLPVTSASLYLGRHPDHIVANYNEVVKERNGEPELWKDIFWQYLALADADRALSLYLADPTYEPFDGESRAHTMHWLYNMKGMGRVDLSTTADIPTYAVFTQGQDTTYIAYNAGAVERTVHFSDGYSMNVPARTTHAESTDQSNPNAPVVLMTADKITGKSPMTVSFKASNSFDRNELPLSYLWTFDTLGTSTAIDTNVVFIEPGSYQIYLDVKNTDGLISSDSLQVQVLPNGTPYKGKPVQVPGTIEAEHYDVGGEGIAYRDVDANNQFYRSGEGVDLSGDGGQVHVNWIVAGEWIEYTFEVKEEGTYKSTPYVATVPGFGNFRLFIDNVDISGKKQVTGTGSFINWKTIQIDPVALSPGRHIMRYEFDTDYDSEVKNWLFSLDKTVVTKTSSTSNQEDVLGIDEFSLAQNYPNPFNPNTQINFSLPQAGQVQLRVYNMLGQQVSVLVDERRNAGAHSIRFNASALASGVYVYELRFNGSVLTNKMILLK
jgi:endoglucanase Acf2